MFLIHELPSLCRQVFSFRSHNVLNYIKTANVEIHDESRYYVKEVHCHWADFSQHFHFPTDGDSKKISRRKFLEL